VYVVTLGVTLYFLKSTSNSASFDFLYLYMKMNRFQGDSRSN
jgi:hypothetical protein